MKITIEQLKACRAYIREIEIIEKHMTRLGRMRQCLTMPLVSGEVSRSGYDANSAKEWQHYDFLEKLYKEKVLEYARLVFLVEQAIGGLFVDQQSVMRLRYIVGVPWKELAETVSFSEARCYQLHTDALEMLFPGRGEDYSKL